MRRRWERRVREAAPVDEPVARAVVAHVVGRALLDRHVAGMGSISEKQEQEFLVWLELRGELQGARPRLL